jgi:DNA-binding HxlR family transcriptional regulator
VFKRSQDRNSDERRREMALLSLRRGIELLAGRWTVAVLAQLAEGGRRYRDLDHALTEVSRKVLTDTLRRAERDGLIVRHIDSNRTETATLYELTDLGRSLDEPLAAIERWVDANWSRVDSARRRWSRRGD